MSNVDHPTHYNAHPSGVECIDIAEHLPFNVANALKYLWRERLKGNASEDREKAAWYLKREAARLKVTNQRLQLGIEVRERLERVMASEKTSPCLYELCRALVEYSDAVFLAPSFEYIAMMLQEPTE